MIENDRPGVQPDIDNRLKELTGFSAHKNWWNAFWSKSSVNIPDPLIAKQYYLGLYKLGAISRPSAPAISVQTIWTADNGSPPPRKGDFHDDLNTQLSYWPSYTGDHLKEG
ncbi:hypothetical protein [Niabella hirudinis]|uniref:hypothetical protein n=1 Tax=Niabella hirudinis TaxID=1285929 RepID=UPI003EB6A9D2